MFTTVRLSSTVLVAGCTALVAVCTTPLQAQQSLVGYTAAGSTAERRAEADAIARPSGTSAAAHSKALSSRIHIAGTPAQATTRDYVVGQMKAWGLETEVRSYQVFMPHATSVHLWRMSPTPKELMLSEPPIAGDPTSQLPQYPTVNGYSGQGDVSAELVYVNYGLIEDYAALDSMGVSVKGKIAIARYGRSYRGIKAREAEKHGAVGLIIYSDPADDGFAQGDVFPAGPMRPAGGVQRGSVFNGDGDPSTPGYPSTPGATRIDTSAMAIPRIPVIPIGYGNAGELLRYLKGSTIPQRWQGGLAFRYHVGPGPVRVRLQVHDDRATHAYKPIYDTFGIIRGTEFPDELVIVGGHRDAWGPGTADNVSGSVSVLEAARAVAELARTGVRPKRTIIFATWDAEEWGVIGSTEYAEDDSLRLVRHGVAYFNQDEAAGGPRFDATGAPSLRETLRDVVRAVPDPAGGSVYDVWREKAGVPAGREPEMGDPGGGSDFAGFYNHLGIPIMDWGFGGVGGVYHSQYDDLLWMSTFGDPGYRYHATAGKIAAAMVLRVANADVLPYDYAEYARTMRTYLGAIDKAFTDKHWTGSSAPLAAALDSLERAATAFAAARDAALGHDVPRDVLERTNQALMDVERATTRPSGLKTRPWYRNLTYAADEDNGYANMPLPSVNEAIRAGDHDLAVREIADLAARFGAAARAVDAARAAISR